MIDLRDIQLFPVDQELIKKSSLLQEKNDVLTIGVFLLVTISGVLIIKEIYKNRLEKFKKNLRDEEF